MSRIESRNNDEALAAFVSRKAEIDTMLARLQDLSAEHFGDSPDEINWGHVGTLGHLAQLLQEALAFVTGAEG